MALWTQALFKNLSCKKRKSQSDLAVTTTLENRRSQNCLLGYSSKGMPGEQTWYIPPTYCYEIVADDGFWKNISQLSQKMHYFQMLIQLVWREQQTKVEKE